MTQSIVPNHSQMHLTLVLADVTARRLAKRKITWVYQLLGLLPCATALFWILVRMDVTVTNLTPFAFFQWLLGLYISLLFTPLLALMLGLGVISDEIETKNITFTLVRPLSRFSITAGRFLGHLLVGSAILSISLIAIYCSSMIFQFEEFFPSMGYLIRALIIQNAAFAAYLGIVSLLGTVIKKMAVVLCIIWIGLDIGFSRIPVEKLQAVSIQYRSLASYPEGGLPMQIGLSATAIEPAPMLYGLLYCLVFASCCCALMTWRLRKEIILSDS